MPHYHIDLQTGDQHQRDNEGSEVVNVEEARKAAINILQQISLGKLAQGKYQEFISMVRAADGTIVYRASLIFHEERLVRMLDEPGSLLSTDCLEA